jgi:hypothetical protein
MTVAAKRVRLARNFMVAVLVLYVDDEMFVAVKVGRFALYNRKGGRQNDLVSISLVQRRV